MKPVLGAVLLLTVLLPASSFGLFENTPGEQFRARLKQLENECRRNPPVPADTRCDLLKVQVEDWRATPEGRFAHSIKIPNPVAEDSGYRKGMKPHEYFEHLCKTEAGEFIFKTVDNVEGIRLMRPRRPVDDYKFRHLYAMEDPYGHMQEEAEEPGFQFVGPTKYEFLETASAAVSPPVGLREYRDPSLFAPPAKGDVVKRFLGYDTRSRKTLRLEHDKKFKSRYGLTWRGLRRPSDREMGIAGGELIALDLESGEVLGVRRGYALYSGSSWEVARLCPKYAYYGGFDKASYFSFWFVGKVARPNGWQEFFAEADRYRLKR